MDKTRKHVNSFQPNDTSTTSSSSGAGNQQPLSAGEKQLAKQQSEYENLSQLCTKRTEKLQLERLRIEERRTVIQQRELLEQDHSADDLQQTTIVLKQQYDSQLAFLRHKAQTRAQVDELHECAVEQTAQKMKRTEERRAQLRAYGDGLNLEEQRRIAKSGSKQHKLDANADAARLLAEENSRHEAEHCVHLQQLKELCDQAESANKLLHETKAQLIADHQECRDLKVQTEQLVQRTKDELSKKIGHEYYEQYISGAVEKLAAHIEAKRLQLVAMREQFQLDWCRLADRGPLEAQAHRQQIQYILDDYAPGEAEVASLAKLCEIHRRQESFDTRAGCDLALRAEELGVLMSQSVDAEQQQQPPLVAESGSEKGDDGQVTGVAASIGGGGGGSFASGGGNQLNDCSFMSSSQSADISSVPDVILLSSQDTAY